MLMLLLMLYRRHIKMLQNLKKKFIGLSNRVTGRRRTVVERERGANPRAAELLNAEERRLDLE